MGPVWSRKIAKRRRRRVYYIHGLELGVELVELGPGCPLHVGVAGGAGEREVARQLVLLVLVQVVRVACVGELDVARLVVTLALLVVRVVAPGEERLYQLDNFKINGSDRVRCEMGGGGA
jgi:hypothetical protein